MNTKEAIETLLSQATAYVETQAAGLRHRDEVEADTPDEKLAVNMMACPQSSS
jgi:hypothetical protein